MACLEHATESLLSIANGTKSVVKMEINFRRRGEQKRAISQWPINSNGVFQHVVPHGVVNQFPF